MRTGPRLTARLAADAAGAAAIVGFCWQWPAAAAGGWLLLPATVVLAAAAGGAMILRWRLPAAATATAGVATLIGTVLGVCQDPMLATAWCLYALAVERAAGTRLPSLLPAALCGVLALVTGVPQGYGQGLAVRFAIAVAALSVAWLLGSAVGRQVLAARAAERARVQLEVARDVHDLVGHALGVIRAQTGVTLSFPDAGEQELRATLADVEHRAREALEDVQTLVRTLRDPDGGRPPGPGQLPSLIAATRAAGVRLDERIDLSGGIGERAGLVVYRIVQEALSNVVRHAPGADCSVDVREESGAVLVSVRNAGGRPPAGGADGAGAAGAGRDGVGPDGGTDGVGPDGGTDGVGADGGGMGGGVGLRGLRERAGLIGGTVTWQSRPGGGFEVNARLPLRAAS